MTTNKPNVQRYADMGCPEQICRVDTMRESDDGDYVLYEDYDALQAECEQLRKDKARLDWLADPDNAIGNVELPEKTVLENVHCMRAAIDAAMKGGEA